MGFFKIEEQENSFDDLMLIKFIEEYVYICPICASEIYRVISHLDTYAANCVECEKYFYVKDKIVGVEEKGG